jgi:hypothetical protein
VAQLGLARLLGVQEVVGSNPAGRLVIHSFNSGAEGVGFEPPAKTSRKTTLLEPADAKPGALDARLARIIGLWPRIDRAGQRRLLRLARRLAKG